ncbi:hypothetical protein [Williamsia maris]|uniref:Uncharacterized protein n=1 Tax=Williamsia maris TaxID=72806 RepID=A0ABT1HAY1_9NOCA|nr:hypothetical protein [Williamsia maris]MCP2175354.1 hypothetical protein [Williamsia maris]
MDPDSHSDDWRPAAADGPVELVVDGQLFQVMVQPDGGCRYTWVTGPNPGYGFSSGAPQVAWQRVGRADPTPPAPLPLPLTTVGRHRQSIRDFLAEIDPETGYFSEE